MSCLALWLIPPVNSTTLSSPEQEIINAVYLLESLGVPKGNLCITGSTGDAPTIGYLPLCETTTTRSTAGWVRSRRQRYLQETEEDLGNRDNMFYITHVFCALACVSIAALAAGLTMGLLSLDPLMLLIKMRAAATEKEQKQAASLLPIVKQHHLLLVTLLLLNACANEALPLFLEVLVSPVYAVILSVTLVLFFGEIIPSAVFTGPNKIEIASNLTPVVRFVMLLLWPFAFPIAKMLDYFLHSEEEEVSMDVFNRGELSALVRIQYEERMAVKKQRHKEMSALRHSNALHTEHIAGLDFSSSRQSTMVDAAIRASKRGILRHQSTTATTESNLLQDHDGDDLLTPNPRKGKSVSIHIDEVAMIEGALQMKTKMAIDVFTPIHRMCSIPYNTVLNEYNVVSIYSSGYSRIPVFEQNPQKPKNHTAIRGILMTKQLIVINPTDERPLETLPLMIPLCVSPKINLVDLLNLFQTGRKGHLALVCARPNIAESSLNTGHAVPEAAGLMGYAFSSVLYFPSCLFIYFLNLTCLLQPPIESLR